MNQQPVRALAAPAAPAPSRRRRPVAVDALEDRRLLANPVIGAFAVTPNNVVTVGTTVTLTATNVTGTPGIANVSFYRESNNVPGLQVGSDASLGAGAANGTTYTRTATIALRNGYHTLYAVATDTDTPRTQVTATTTLSVGNLAALGPTNDNFVNATAISTVVAGGGTVTVAGSSLLATHEAGEPLHAGRIGGKSVWYFWTPATSGRATVTTAGSAFDTLLGVYTGSTYGVLKTVAANDNDRGAADATSAVAFNAVAGRTYRIAVDGIAGLGGNYALHLTQALPITAPTNDDFANPRVLSGGNVSWSGTNVGGSLEAGEPAHAGRSSNNGGSSVWFTWTAPITGDFIMSTAGSSFDTALGVYVGGNVANLFPVAADDNGGPGNTSELTFTAFAGQRYRIAIAGYGLGGQGDISFNIRAA